MRAVRNLIFDLDGTLIDSSEGIIDAVNFALEQAGQPGRSPEEIKRYIGAPLEQMFRDFTDYPFEELNRHFRVRADTSVVAAAVPMDGVGGILEMLHLAGYRMALATTKVRRNIDGIVAKLGWKNYFPVAVGGDEVTRVKPAPDAFRSVLDQLGVSPDQSIVIGDTENDIIAAKAVPIRVVAVSSPFADRDEIVQSKPDYFIRNIAWLPGLLAEIDRKSAEVK
jgi:phosphoglycolate phosphatase